MKKLLLISLISLTINSNAQIWGTGAAVGASDGEFANAFVQSTLASNYNTTSWTALSINDDNGTATPGNAFWARDSDGISHGYYTPVGNINSPTNTNGVALFDSDFLDNAGTGSTGTGSSPSTHKGELISPTIDLTGHTNDAIAVKFYCAWRNFTANVGVSLSVDDGVSWNDIDVNTLLPAAQNVVNAGWVTAVFPSVTAGINTLTNCRIKFTFDGYYYYYMVDDVSISVANPIDLSIVIEGNANDSLASTLHYGNVTNNRHFPLSQLSVHHFNFGANIKNLGTSTITPADAAKLWVAIEKNVSGTWTQVHNQSVLIPNIAPVSIGTGTLITGVLSSANWASVGSFRTRYLVEQSSDAVAANDTLYQYFDLTNENYASKVDVDNNSNPAHTTAVFPSGSNFSNVEYGSMFEFSDATASSLAIDSVSFAYQVPFNYIGGGSINVLVNIYQFIDGNNDGHIDAAGSELTHIGAKATSVSGLATTSPIGSYQAATVSGFLDPNTGNPVTSLTNGYYLITTSIVASSNGLASFNSPNVIHFAASNIENYAVNMNSSTGANNIANASSSRTLNSSGVGNWNWLGYGASMTPSIGVHLSGTNVINAVANINNANSGIKIFPNPTTGKVNFSSDKEINSIDVLNSTGQKVATFNNTNTIDISQLPNGIYIAKVSIENGNYSIHKLIKEN